MATTIHGLAGCGESLLAGLRDHGGATVTRDGAVPTHGYVVGRPGLGVVFDGVPTVSDVELWLALLADDATAVGSWHDRRTGRVYFDAVDIFDDVDTAMSRARARGELAIFDLAHARELRVSDEER